MKGHSTIALNSIVRANPGAAAAARRSARDAGKQVGQWLEEAIAEKQKRQKGEEDITKAGLLRNWKSAQRTCTTCSTGRDCGERIYTRVT